MQQALSPDVLKLITTQLSLLDVARWRGSSQLFRNLLTPSYIDKIEQFIHQKSVIQVARGDKFELILLQDGSVYGRGDNTKGTIGLGKDVTQTDQFNLIQGLPIIREIAASGSRAYYLTEQGEIFMTGLDTVHLITNNTEANPEIIRNVLLRKPMCMKPYRIPELQNIISMSVNTHTSFFINHDGNVFGCGDNDNGRILPGGQNVVQELVLIEGITHATHVFAQKYHTVVQCEDKLAILGLTTLYQPCIQPFNSLRDVRYVQLPFIPKKICETKKSSYILAPDDQLYVCGELDGVPVKLKCIGPANECAAFSQLIKDSEFTTPYHQLILDLNVLLALNKKNNKVILPDLILKLNELFNLLSPTTDIQNDQHNNHTM